MVSIVHLADMLVHTKAIGSGGDTKIPHVHEDTLQLLGLNRNGMKKFLDEMTEAIDKIDTILPLMT